MKRNAGKQITLRLPLLFSFDRGFHGMLNCLNSFDESYLSHLQ